MKNSIIVLFVLSLCTISCKKESALPIGECGNTGIYGPVKYYLTPYDKSLFTFYKLFHSLTFVDSVTNDTTKITYSSDAQVWNQTTGQSQVQGDTVNYGEDAGIAYNYGTNDIGRLAYHFNAYPNGVDSMRIFLNGGNPLQQYPTYTFFWTLNLTTTNSSSTTGYTPFVLLDSITFLSHTFHSVYFLQNGNSLSPSDSSNNCYYTKANGIIAFTDKRYNKFWIRTNY